MKGKYYFMSNNIWICMAGYNSQNTNPLHNVYSYISGHMIMVISWK